MKYDFRLASKAALFESPMRQMPRPSARLFLLFAIFGLSAMAAGCLSWPMFRHDSRHTGQSQFSTAAIKGLQKWKFAFPAGCRIVSSPAVDVDEKIYIGVVCGSRPSETGGFCAINSNGKSAWCNINLQGSPVFSSAGIGTNAVYVAGLDSGQPGLLAINGNNGQKIWTFPGPILFSPPTPSSVLSKDLSVTTTIYVGGIDGTLFAIRADGTEQWHFALGSPDVRASIVSSPAVAPDGTVYVGFNGGGTVIGNSPAGGLLAVNPDGSQKWIYGGIGGVDSSPAVANDGTIYFGAHDQFFYALKPNGTAKWSIANLGDIFSSPALAAGGSAIYFGSRDHHLYAFDPNALFLWAFTTGAEVDSSPSISRDGTIFVGSRDHYLYAINPNGTLKWKFLTGAPISSSPAIGQGGSAIYVGSENGVLYAIQ